MTPLTVQTLIRVKPSDTGLHGEVRCAKYWDYVEAAENDFYRALGMPEHELYDGLGLPRVAVRLAYHAPACLDDLLEVNLGINRITPRTFTFAIRITNSREPRQQRSALIAEGEMVICCVDLQGRSRELPDDLLNRIERFLHSASDPPI